MRSPQIKINKIRGLNPSILNSLKIQGMSAEIIFQELLPILTQLQNKGNMMNEDLKNHIRRYLIIRLVTILEVFFTDWIVKLIDVYKLPYTNLFENPNINIPISKLKDIKNDTITEGKIIATSFNMQDISEINQVFSKLIMPDFLKKVKGSKINREKKKESNKYIANWDKFLNIFNDRHNLVHTLNRQAIYSDKELQQIIEASQWFILFFELLIGHHLIQIRREELKKHDSFIFDFIKDKYHGLE